MLLLSLSNVIFSVHFYKLFQQTPKIATINNKGENMKEKKNVING